MRRTIVGLMMFAGMVISGPVVAGALEDGEADYRRGEFLGAYSKWRRLADGGDPAAQFRIAQMYYRGTGVPRDYAEASKWCRRAAEQGEAPAQLMLGYMYDKGLGVPQHFAEAFEWYRRAADQGDPVAQGNLGNMYFEGRGVARSYVQAHLYWNLAASRLPASAVEERRAAAKNRDGVVRMMTPAQVAEAQRLAREWRPK